MSEEIYSLVKKLFPINRSITGDGVRETLRIIKDIIPISIEEIPSGTQVYDWAVPEEWNVKSAYIEDCNGNTIVDIKDCNLHLVGYSVPINKWVSLDELQKHLHSDCDKPNAIPYITSYYKKTWGFCIEHYKREKLKDGQYRVVIDSEFKDGSMTYGELIIKGKTDNEVLLSTYVCHPSMANNELSGPCLLTYLCEWMLKKDLVNTYRVIFIPETIGALAYMDKNFSYIKNRTIAGINISCVGDSGTFSYIPTRYGNTLSDKVAKNILRSNGVFIEYSFLDRGSNEKIFCAPGFDLPIINITRSKFNTYKEYHTSLDNLDFVTPKAFSESFIVYKRFITALEKNVTYVPHFSGEPCLGKVGLYDQKDSNTLPRRTQTIKDFLAYVDGTNDLVDISNIIKVPIDDLYDIVDILLKNNIIGKLR